jgi:hypothetical protein
VIGVLSDQVGLPKTLALLALAALTVTALGGRATRPQIAGQTSYECGLNPASDSRVVD